MKKYRVMLEGRNFLIEMDGEAGKYGFFQNFFIESESPAEAENAAVQKVRKNADLLAATMNSKDDPPAIHLEAIDEMQEFPEGVRPESGIGWYSEDEEKEKLNRPLDATAEPSGMTWRQQC
jgi:hypothetical protein